MFQIEKCCSGTVMLASLPIILGVQFLLAFLAYDIGSQPQNALHRRLRSFSRSAGAKPKVTADVPAQQPPAKERVLDDALTL